MKIYLFIYFIVHIFFINILNAKDDNQLFKDAVKILKVQLSVYSYGSETQDPFKQNDFSNNKNNKNFNLFLDNPLRSANLEDYKLIGLVWETKIPKAIIKDTNGKTHILKKGDYLGNRQGQIIKIREGEVVVLELTEREDGEGTLYKTNVLTFSDLFIDNKNKKTKQ
ncbi:MAG: pilus assembly protein PilP [Bdellovibrionales bacterium]|nr:pilus assembly protein PilP [Bdellovibrionales bacterium]